MICASWGKPKASPPPTPRASVACEARVSAVVCQLSHTWRGWPVRVVFDGLVGVGHALGRLASSKRSEIRSLELFSGAGTG